MAHVYLTPAQVIERWQGALSVRTLANWRSQKKGPPVTKLGNKSVYRLDLLEKWEQTNSISAN